jgi:uncharacterized protein (TIGR03437 family)
MRLTAVLLFLAATGMAIAQPTVGGVVNGASFSKTNPIGTGGLVSIFGTNLAAAPAGADTIPLSTSLGGVTVMFSNGSTSVEAPLLYLQSNQINAVVPWELLPGGVAADVNVVVTNGGASSQPFAVKAAQFSPGIFTIGNLAAVQNTDGSLAQPAGSIPGRATHPAKIGDVVIIYATGLGPVTPNVSDGAIPPAGTTAHTIHQPTVLFGGHSAVIQFSGLSPQFVGVYQLNVVVPDIVPRDNVPLQLSLGGIATSSSITVAVSQ